MAKRLQVILTDEAWALVDKTNTEVMDGFKMGTVNFSDVINEMILNSKIEVKELRLKHTELKKSLIILAQTENLDIESAIKTLSELKGKITKRVKNSNSELGKT